ncbi:hypothetical protein [Coraliomargarita akajimensis]|uniref:Uncharacterized protein n=1 Tax=Coraliomargarita akajimensis (strain DSM 45221 / IAM 15411 / JCM 23193 / KCTC 12865 / 04OKA010-24) TaxID=583355 RepID=D5EI64_CORAD|nr:hypothetical protein [Coraliomargarita akajimensis]ADE56104.1 hypothetical protein Caka_3091 [Coraliomargarita akajimensis DSM 45221]
MKATYIIVSIFTVLQLLTAGDPFPGEYDSDWLTEAKQENPYRIEIRYGEIPYGQRNELKEFDPKRFVHFDSISISTAPNGTSEIERNEELHAMTKIREHGSGFNVLFYFRINKGENQIEVGSSVFVERGEWIVLGTITDHEEVENFPEHLIPKADDLKTVVALRICANR